ncbi:MAG: hypothetical protein RL510_1121 [Actinomycetota bacterium]|jgi:hypothetical protein
MRTKSGLLIAIITAASLALSGCTTQKVTLEPATANFLAGKFVTAADGTYLEGFTPGKPDVGFTLEAIAQLSQSGDDIDVTKAEEWALSNTESITDDSGNLILGLAAKWLFVSEVLDFENKDAREFVLSELTSHWSEGSSAEKSGNTFDYAWQALALQAAGKQAEAERAAEALSQIRRVDNGWGTDLSDSTTASSTDATAIALMAFIATGLTDAADVAKAWLKANIKADHFEAWGDVDVNGTAYAAMALQAAGEDVAPIKAWLASRVAKDGGLETPWSAGAGDVFATAQGYLPLIGLNYVELSK